MKRSTGTIVLLLATAACHLAIHREQNQAVREHPDADSLQLPSVIGGFRQFGPDVQIDESVLAVLQTSLIMGRNYVSPKGVLVQLTIVHAGKTRRSLHFPEVCLVGQGWEVQRQQTSPVGFSFSGKRLVLNKGNHRQAVLYWFKTRDKFTGNYFLNSWYWAREQLLFGRPTSSLIKLATMIENQSEETAFQALEDMAMALAPILLDRVQ